MTEFLEFVELHKAAFWFLPVSCFVAAAVMAVIHKRRQQ